MYLVCTQSCHTILNSLSVNFRLWQYCEVSDAGCFQQCCHCDSGLTCCFEQSSTEKLKLRSPKCHYSNDTSDVASDIQPLSPTILNHKQKHYLLKILQRLCKEEEEEQYCTIRDCIYWLASSTGRLTVAQPSEHLTKVGLSKTLLINSSHFSWK